MTNPIYKILAIIGLVLLLFVGVFFVFFYSWSSSENEVVETSIPEAIVSAVSIDASGQKVYSNSTHHYEFKFPANWKFAEYNGGVVAVDPKRVLSSEEFNMLDLPAGGFIIRPETQFSYVIGYESFPTTKIGLDNISVKYYKQVNGSNTDNPAWKNTTSYVYYVPSKDGADDGVVIQIIYPNGDANASAYTKILASFKFTDSSAQFYENEYMKIAIPTGWTATQANKTIYYGTCLNGKDDCTTVPKIEPNPAAVNIRKGNYILYINVHASQASGVEGGRFGEIAAGAPSAEAVIKEWPSEPCGSSQAITNKFGTRSPLVRYDFYMNNRDGREYCNSPKDNSTVWYFSYVSDSKAYFNYYENIKPADAGYMGYVITMAYNSRDVNLLPKKGSAELNAMLAEMSSIVKTLELKQK